MYRQILLIPVIYNYQYMSALGLICSRDGHARVMRSNSRVTRAYLKAATHATLSTWSVKCDMHAWVFFVWSPHLSPTVSLTVSPPLLRSPHTSQPTPQPTPPHVPITWYQVTPRVTPFRRRQSNTACPGNRPEPPVFQSRTTGPSAASQRTRT